MVWTVWGQMFLLTDTTAQRSQVPYSLTKEKTVAALFHPSDERQLKDREKLVLSHLRRQIVTYPKATQEGEI